MSTLFFMCPVFPSLLGSQGELQLVLVKRRTSWLEPEVEFMITLHLILAPCSDFLATSVWLGKMTVSCHPSVQPNAFLGFCSMAMGVCCQLSPRLPGSVLGGECAWLSLSCPHCLRFALVPAQESGLQSAQELPFENRMYPCGGYRTRSSGRYLAYAGA